MRGTVGVFVAVLMLALGGHGQGVLEKAEAAYRRGDYAAARDAYASWLKTHDDGRVEYDLGNTQFRLGDYGRALWRYERARRRLGDREDVVFNRNLAQRKLGRGRTDAKGIAASVKRRFHEWQAGSWFKLGVGLEGLGLLVLAFWFKRRSSWSLVVALLLLAPGVFAFTRALSVDDTRPLGVIILDDGTPLRGEPREQLAAIVTLGAGVRADLLSMSDHWLKIRVKGRVGWVPRPNAGVW